MPPHVCQSCKQNPATIHLTTIHEKTKQELHVCEACAAAQGLAGGPVLPDLPSMLASLVKPAKGPQAPAPRCPTCGISFAEFREKGRLGCPNDYTFFAEHLDPLLEKIHGASQHRGRLPAGTPASESGRGEALLRLRGELQKAVKAEQYERAAQLRDEIRRLEEPSAAGEGAAPAAPAPADKPKPRARGKRTQG